MTKYNNTSNTSGAAPGAAPTIGSIYEGKVVNVLDFGAFVDFGFGQDGMVHISEVSNERIANLQDVLKRGDTVMVKLIDFDHKGRSKLSIRRAKDGEGVDEDSGYGNGGGRQPDLHQIYDGKVVKITDFGAFVDYGFGRDGMVHISEIAPNRIEHVTDVLAIGDPVKVRFLGLDARGRVKLSIKQAQNELSRPVESETYNGTVVQVERFGLFVSFGFAQDGMVHISEIDLAPGQELQDVIHLGEKVEVKFLGFDERGRSKLSLRQA
jgi:small subunit ribosomal protein S1